MQRKARIFLIAALLGGSAAASASMAADAPHYRVTELATLGAGSGIGNSINDFGLVSGNSGVGTEVRATAWLYGAKVDLGTLGGAYSAVLWPVKNNFGVISGIAQTNKPNPLNEPWSCGSFLTSDGHSCLGFVWAFGRMRALPPLPGGYNSFATGTNNRLQTVGWAENGVHDPQCDPESGQILQFLPVVWGPGRNQMHTLPLLPGDDSGAATAINDRGDVVGISGTCDQAVGRHTARHMVLWKNGHAIDLEDIGGDAWNTPMAINRHGDIVGFANTLPGPGLSLHAFFRSRAGGPPLDLGVLRPDDTLSEALGINDHGQVVGISCGSDCHGFLYQNDEMIDINDLVVDYPGVIIDAQDINAFGQITGQAYKPATGEYVTFRADPIPNYHGHTHRQRPARKVTLPDTVTRKLLGHFGVGRAWQRQ